MFKITPVYDSISLVPPVVALRKSVVQEKPNSCNFFPGSNHGWPGLLIQFHEYSPEVNEHFFGKCGKNMKNSPTPGVILENGATSEGRGIIKDVPTSIPKSDLLCVTMAVIHVAGQRFLAVVLCQF